MKFHLGTLIAAGALAVAFTGGASAQNRQLIDCMLDVNQAHPACQGRGNTGLQYRGQYSTVTPEARTYGRGMAGSERGSRGLINCSLDVNQGHPACQGRGNTGLQYRGQYSGVTPGARTYGPGATGSVGGQRNLINCSLDVNQGHPACLGRGGTGIQYRGDYSEVTAGQRMYRNR